MIKVVLVGTKLRYSMESSVIRGNKMTKIEQIKEHQRQLQIQFRAWMDDKKKREVLTFMRPNGNIVRHYPDGHEEIIEYAK